MCFSRNYHRLKDQAGKVVPGIFILWALIQFSSCTVEYRLARDYIGEKPAEALLVIPADFIYKSNLTYQEPDPVNMISQRAMDSVGFYRSTYLQYTSDSIFLEIFYNAFIGELAASGYSVYLPQDSNVFTGLGERRWTISFEQLQLEEQTQTFAEDTYDPEENYYYKEYEVTTVGMNTWTEAVYAGAPDQQRLLYLSGYIEDDFEGGFRYNQFDDKMYFSDRTVKITYQDIYKMAVDSGKKHAELLIDYMLNDYIRRNMPPGATHRQLYHFDRQFRTLSVNYPQRFEVLK